MGGWGQGDVGSFFSFLSSLITLEDYALYSLLDHPFLYINPLTPFPALKIVFDFLD